jgi:hypothetical protein
MHCDDDARARRVETYALDQLAAAWLRLEELYRESEPGADAIAGSLRRTRAVRPLVTYGAGNWHAVREANDPDTVLIDHRPGMFGRLEGADAVVERLRGIETIATDYSMVLEQIHGATDDAIAWTLRVRGRGADGNDFDLDVVAVFRLGDNGTTLSEMWNAEDLATALARYRELTDTRSLAMRHFDRWAAAPGSDADVASFVTDDLEFFDHTLQVAMDVEQHRLQLRRIAAAPGAHITWEPILFLGDRHGLARVHNKWDAASARGHWSAAGAGETTSLFVVRCAPDGRVQREHLFSPEQSVDALLVLEQMYRDDEADDAVREASRRREFLWKMLAAYNRDDWAGVRDALDPVLTLVDHRPSSWGTIGRDEYIEILRGLREVAIDRRFHVDRVPLCSGEGVVVSVRVNGVDPSGGTFEIVNVNCVLLGPNGATYGEIWETDVDAAIARLRELTD